jgi:5'-3' exonuclease
MDEAQEQFEDEAPAPAGDTQSLVEVVDMPKGADGCLVVDVSNLAYRSFHAYSSLKAKDGRASGHVYGSVRLLLATLRNYLDPGKWCIVYAYDGAGAKELRRKTLPEYKGSRDDGRFNPCPEVKTTLADMPGLHIEQAEREGDDAITWITDKLAASGQKVTVLTGDRDLWQLKRHPSVSIYSPNLKRYVIPDDIRGEYYVEDAGRIPIAKALFGDSSDNVRGVERLIRKTVAPLLNKPEVVDIDSFYHWFGFGGPEVGKITNAAQTKIALAEQQVRRNYAVVMPMLDGFGPHSVRRARLVPEARERMEKHLLEYDCVALVGMLDQVFGKKP